MKAQSRWSRIESCNCNAAFHSPRTRQIERLMRKASSLTWMVTGHWLGLRRPISNFIFFFLNSRTKAVPITLLLAFGKECVVGG